MTLSMALTRLKKCRRVAFRTYRRPSISMEVVHVWIWATYLTILLSHLPQWQWPWSHFHHPSSPRSSLKTRKMLQPQSNSTSIRLNQSRASMARHSHSQCSFLTAARQSRRKLLSTRTVWRTIESPRRRSTEYLCKRALQTWSRSLTRRKPP